MVVRLRLLFLSVLSIICISCICADARRLVVSDISGAYAGNERICTICEQFTSMALDYLNKNKTQTEVINTLHRACSRLRSFQQECIRLVDYYGPLFFIEIGTTSPEDFCEKVNLCEDLAVVALQGHPDTCSICHRAVVEVLLKMKDPDTQIEIIDLLLKACDMVEGYASQCKKVVFEYGPLIMTKAEQFLETRDVCIAIHACKASSEEASIIVPLSEMVDASKES